MAEDVPQQPAGLPRAPRYKPLEFWFNKPSFVTQVYPYLLCQDGRVFKESTDGAIVACLDLTPAAVWQAFVRAYCVPVPGSAPHVTTLLHLQ
jgi:hypothetical protein